MTEETTLVVDINEPDRVRMLTLGHPDVDNWKEARLDAADIVVNGVGIERKRPGDFAASMLEDRLDEQVRKLDEAYDEAVILIEGNGFADFSTLDQTSLNPQSARGKAASTHMRWGIPVVPTGGTPGTESAHRLLVDYAIRLGRKATEEPSSDYLRGSVVGSDEPLGKRLWGCVGGVGPTRAGSLYEVVGSPIDFSVICETTDASPIEELTKIDGIGEKTARDTILEIWGGSEGSWEFSDRVERRQGAEHSFDEEDARDAAQEPQSDNGGDHASG